MGGEATLRSVPVAARERRAHPRFAVDEQAELLVVGHGRWLEGRILDLSLEGCRMHTAAHLPGGGRVKVEVTFTINGVPFRMGGLVQRSSESEIGVRFVDVSAHRQSEWAAVVEEIQTLAAKAAEKAAEKAAASEADGESSPGAEERERGPAAPGFRWADGFLSNLPAGRGLLHKGMLITAD